MTYARNGLSGFDILIGFLCGFFAFGNKKVQKTANDVKQTVEHTIRVINDSKNTAVEKSTVKESGGIGLVQGLNDDLTSTGTTTATSSATTSGSSTNYSSIIDAK